MPTIDANSMCSISVPKLEEEEEKPESESMKSFIRLPKKESVKEIFRDPSIVPPPVEEVVDIEYDKILNLGVQRIMEERKNILRFRNISKNNITWKICAVWDDKEPAIFRFGEDQGELEAG